LVCTARWAGGDGTARTVPPFLWFLGKAEEAIKLYVSLFLDGEIVELTRYDVGEAKGLVRSVRFIIGGKTVLGTDHITEPDGAGPYFGLE
jgi:predicted 3-demethylubiquinone-9 3-methyltransferase (glyoxalase superfamily)